MNVIKFDLEIKKRLTLGRLIDYVSEWRRKVPAPIVGELFTDAFISEHYFT